MRKEKKRAPQSEENEKFFHSEKKIEFIFCKSKEHFFKCLNMPIQISSSFFQKRRVMKIFTKVENKMNFSDCCFLKEEKVKRTREEKEGKTKSQI